VLAYREVIEAVAGSDCSRMIAKAQAYWPREAGPDVPERLLRTWRLAETLLGEFLQELSTRPVSFPATDATPVQWETKGTSVGELAAGMGGPAFYRFMRQEDGDVE